MIDLRFGTYGIKTADKLNIVLVQYGTVQDTASKNYGNETEKVLGYYSNIEHALRRYMTLTENTCNADSINTLFEQLKKLDNHIELICEQLKSSKDIYVGNINEVQNG